ESRCASTGAPVRRRSSVHLPHCLWACSTTTLRCWHGFLVSMRSRDHLRLDINRIFSEVGYNPHPAQRLFHRSTARNRIVAAGRRIGKSRMGAAELDIEAIRTKFLLSKLEDANQRREFWIVGPEY